MKVISTTIAISLMIFTTFVSADNSRSHPNLHSKYKGQENRSIKSLSADDITELTKGGGWGLAKAAELNGVPGPAHILEMEKQINLTEDQKVEIQKLFDSMNEEAVVLGKKLIQLETKLNNAFAENDIDQEQLVEHVREIEKVRSELRIAHLSTHLKTPNILSKHQIMLYNQLRGYGKANPCENIPEGHNAEMWKKHNGCS